ncbi:MAG: hypothetical protein ABIK65_01280 [Candidatus Eisenbacteria bacterium]
MELRHGMCVFVLVLSLLSLGHCSPKSIESRPPDREPPAEREMERPRVDLEKLESAYGEGIDLQKRGEYRQADSVLTGLIARVDSLTAGRRSGTSLSRSLSHLRSKAAFFREAARTSAESERREDELKLRRSEIERSPLWVSEERASVRESPDPNSAVVAILGEGDMVFRAGGDEQWFRVRIPVDSLSRDPVSTLEALEARYVSGWVPASFVSGRAVPKPTPEELRERASRREAEAAAARDRLRREEYLRSHPDQPAEVRDAILAGEVTLGMSTEMVGASLGEPEDVRRTISAAGAREQWTYPTKAGTLRSLYFENGVLTAYEE